MRIISVFPTQKSANNGANEEQKYTRRKENTSMTYRFTPLGFLVLRKRETKIYI